MELQSQDSNNMFDTFLYGWLNSIKFMNTYQREVESVTLKAIERQKDIWIQTKEQLEKLEIEIDHFLADVNCNLTENQEASSAEEWNKRSEEIFTNIQQIFGSYKKEDPIKNHLEQLESDLKMLIENQQKNREEVYSYLESLTDQVKKTFKSG